VETRRRRAGAPVLALLALAGLLRPEAWLFAGAYWLYLAWADPQDRARLARLAALAALAPVLWLLFDLIVTGDPLHTLTGTRDTAETLGRVTGLQHVPSTVPRRLGEILREPVLFGAAGGGLLSLLWLRERARLGAVAGVLSLAAFCVLAAAGLPILGRYLLLPATILALFCGAGAFGWMNLPAQDARRRPWQALAVVTGVLLLAFVPAQVNRIGDLRDALAIQDGIQDDLAALVRDDVVRPDCRPIAVPNHRPVPLLALWLDVRPQQIVSAAEETPARGTYVAPATAKVAKDYILDPRDKVQAVPRAPAGFRPAGGNATWRVFATCG
jgi:hypothetical protein